MHFETESPVAMLAASESTGEAGSTETAPAAKPKRSPKKRPASAKQKKVAAKPVKSIGKQIAAAGSGTPLKTICAKLKIEPKLARRKLRAAKLDFHGHRERWTFNARQAEKVAEILSA